MGQISRKALALQKCTWGAVGAWASAGIRGGQPAWESCQQRQDGPAGHLLASVQIQDDRVGGGEGPFTLLSQKKGSTVSTGNVSLWFWRSGDNPDPLSAPSQQRRLWFLTVKRNKGNGINKSYCVCAASAGDHCICYWHKKERLTITMPKENFLNKRCKLQFK